MTSNHDRGRFVWYDLMTTDTDAAIEYYGKVIGWGTQPFQGAQPPYTMWTVGDTPIGGVSAMDAQSSGGAPPSWMAHISTPDVDATADRIKQLGGSVLHEPMDIPNTGRFAIVADPQGAAFGIYTSNVGSSTSDESPRTGEFSWNELATSDYRAAFDFYNDLFGWEITDDYDMGPMGIYRIFGRNGRDLGGMFDKPAEMPGPPFWLYYVAVDGVHRAAEVVKEQGGQVINGPMEVPGGSWIAQCMDPQGAAFAIHGDK